MTSRNEGDLDGNYGKFHQYWLEEVEVSEAKTEAALLSPAQKQATWCRRVKELLDDHIQKTWAQGMEISMFLTLWSRRYPHDAVAWYQPAGKMMRSMEECGEVTRDSQDRKLVVWRPVPSALASACLVCGKCKTSHEKTGRPMYECTRCRVPVCVMCGLLASGAVAVFECKDCLPPWRRHLRGDMLSLPPWRRP